MLLIISYILAAIGVLLSLIGFPGVWLVFIAIVISSFHVGTAVLPVWLLFVYFLASLASGLIDNIAIIAGAHKFGASKWGMVGAVVGGIVGFVIGNIFGLVFGPFFGAVAFEILFAGKKTDLAIKAGAGTFFGYVVAVLFRFILSVAMVGSWLYLLLR